MSRQLSLSVLVPVYNEQHLVAEALSRLRILEGSELLSSVEVIVVDDGSTDGTSQVLAAFERQQTARRSGSLSWTFLQHEKNLGKGSAIRTALARASGQIVIIHDADLEYHPKDMLRMVKVFLDEKADAVFGSRFAGSEVRRALFFRHQLANKLLTFACNLVSNLNLTDVWTCYKAIRLPLLKSIPIASNDFRLEPELTIKLAKRDARVFEVPISYSGRTYQEGKKIGWRDACFALLAIIRFGLSDHIYVADEHGSHILARLGRAPRFNSWMADVVRPFCGERVLEIGSGVGNLTRYLLPRASYLVSDVNPLYLQTLDNLGADRPYVTVTYCDVTDASSFPKTVGGFDTVICLNVLEHVEDDRRALSNIRSVLCPGGRAIILVPQGPWNFGTLDGALGHRRRYTRQMLSGLAKDCGLRVRDLIEFNRAGTIAWYLSGKLLRAKSFGLTQVWLLNLLTPLLRRMDPILPMPPLSLIAIMERPSEIDATSETEVDASRTQPTQ